MAPWNAAMTTELNTLTQDFELILLSTEGESSHYLSDKLQANLANKFLDKSLLEEQLEKLLIQHSEELEDRELSLDELEDLGGGPRRPRDRPRAFLAPILLSRCSWLAASEYENSIRKRPIPSLIDSRPVSMDF